MQMRLPLLELADYVAFQVRIIRFIPIRTILCGRPQAVDETTPRTQFYDIHTAHKKGCPAYTSCDVSIPQSFFASEAVGTAREDRKMKHLRYIPYSRFSA